MEKLGKTLGMVVIIAIAKVAVILATQELETLTTSTKPSKTGI